MNDEEDEKLRLWALDAAIESDKKGTKTEKILNRAERYYGFITRKSAAVENIKGVKRDG